MGTVPIGTGPFKFKEWVSGDHLLLDRFDDYYQGRPKVAHLEMKIVPDENAAFTLLKSGELDIYQSAAISQYDALKKLGWKESIVAYTCSSPPSMLACAWLIGVSTQPGQIALQRMPCFA